MPNNLEFNQVTDKEIWKDVINLLPQANFLQSLEWASFHKSLGKDSWAFLITENGQNIGVMVVVKEEAKRGDYLTVAGGPVLLPSIESNPDKLKQVWQEITQFLKEFSTQEKVWFVRVRPQLLDTIQNRDLLLSLGFTKSAMHLTADLTFQLDLNLSPDELLANMRKNTRYEIRKADKVGIEVVQSTNPEDIREFYQHQLVLSQKHGFVPFSEKFLHEQFVSFLEEDQVVLFHAYHEQKLLASAFVIFYNHEAVYHYGISTPDNNKLPGSYACQWAAILEAKKRGCTRYNFWGIAPEEAKEHRFAGVSLFKRGFGGEEVAYLPAHDLPVSKLYGLTKGFETIRKMRRGL